MKACANPVATGQLQKIGVLSSSKTTQATPSSVKRRSGQLDFSNLGPLKSTGTVGFSTFRDQGAEATRRRKARKKSIGNVSGALNDDSDDDDDEDSAAMGKMEEIDEKDFGGPLAPEDLQSQGELADGVNRIHLKRAHSADQGSDATKNPAIESSTTLSSSAGASVTAGLAAAVTSEDAEGTPLLPNSVFGSPMKKQRPSLAGPDDPSLKNQVAASEAALSQQPSSHDANPPVGAHGATREAEEEEEL